MPQIPSRFVDIIQQLKENKQPRRATVRSVLKWFNAARRGANVVIEVEEALKLAGLKTEPPFAQAGIDDPLAFLLQTSTNGQVAETTPDVEQPESASASSAPDDGEKPSAEGNGAAAALSPDLLEPEDDTPVPAKADDRPVSSQPHLNRGNALRQIRRGRSLSGILPGPPSSSQRPWGRTPVA